MASQQEIVKEANARFWVTTFYKPGVPLQASDTADKFMARQWLSIYKQLVNENARGTLSLTYKHSGFADRLNDAIRAYQVESTTNVRDPRYAEARATKAQALNEAAMWHEMLISPSRERIAGF